MWHLLAHLRVFRVHDGAVVESATHDSLVVSAVHANGLARRAVPQSSRGVGTRRDEIRSVDAEDAIPHPTLVSLEHALQLKSI